MPEFASLGYLYALDGSDLLADESDFLATPLSSNKYNGKTYGVPQVTDSLALLYNKKIFTDAGITAAPKTWAEVRPPPPPSRRRPARTACSSTRVATSCCRSSTARAATWSTPAAKKIVVNSARERGRHQDRAGPGQQRRRGQAAGQRLLRHHDDPVQGAEGRHDHQRPVGGQQHQQRPDLRRPREPRHRARSRPAAPRPAPRSAATTT